MIDKLKEEYHPDKVLVVYRNHESSENYIEKHDIKNGEVMEGVPLQKKTLYELLSACSDNAEVSLSFRGLIPGNVLYYNCNAHSPILIWFEPACNRHLKFEGKLPSGKYNLPPVIFRFDNEDLAVYATKTIVREKLSADEKLFHLPLPNIYSDHKVCMGTVDMEIKQDLKSIEEIMELSSTKFWKSVFTEFHAPEAIKGVNVYDFWQKHIGKPNPFPLEILKESKTKIKHLWIE